MKGAFPLFAIVALALALVLGACQGKGTSSTTTQKVTLALATIPDTALAQVAASRGYFADEGLALTIHQHKFGKPALQEVLNGQADFATVAETPVMLAIMDGKKISVVSSIMTSTLSHAIIARRDRDIAELQDLKGKTVGTSLGTTADFYLHSLLVINGISPEELKLVNLPPEQLPAALERGDIDAASTFLPFTAIIQKGLGKQSVVFRDKNLYRVSFTLAAQSSFVAQHPDTVSRMLKALIRAETFIKEHPEEARKIVAKNCGLDSDIVASFWADTTLATSLDQTLLLSLEEESRWAMRYGLTRATQVPNYLDFIYLDGLRSLKPDAVRILK